MQKIVTFTRFKRFFVIRVLRHFIIIALLCIFAEFPTLDLILKINKSNKIFSSNLNRCKNCHYFYNPISLWEITEAYASRNHQWISHFSNALPPINQIIENSLNKLHSSDQSFVQHSPLAFEHAPIPIIIHKSYVDGQNYTSFQWPVLPE